MKNKLKLAYCLSLFLCISTQIVNAQTYPAYHSDHACSASRNDTNGICGLLNKIRLNGSVATTSTEPEVILAAHRGEWGGDIPENTAKAFNDAIFYQIKLLEADIMPAGITNYTDPAKTDFGTPTGMVCFHDFKLQRMTTLTTNDYVFSKTETQLTGITLKKPRSLSASNHKICSLLQLVTIANSNNVVACLDVKNLENDGTKELTQWNTPERKFLSLTKNLKWIIKNIPEAHLKNVAIKTYEKFTVLYNAVTAGETTAFATKFNKILWIPMIAKNDKSLDATNTYIDVNKVNSWVNDWNSANPRVLYYEVNVFSDTDPTSKLLEPVFLKSIYSSGVSVCNGINKLTQRRVGIFSEEPVGSKGTVNRWGRWSYKDPSADRRGDPLWLMNDIPEMKKGVITTDRPDVWDDSINISIANHK